MENYVNRSLSDKSMNFGIMVVHDITKDISYIVFVLLEFPPLLKEHP